MANRILYLEWQTLSLLICIQSSYDCTTHRSVATCMQDVGALEAEIALQPISFQDLRYWTDALFNESLADDLADDMTSLGLLIDNVTYTAKFAFGASLPPVESTPLGSQGWCAVL